MAGDKVRVCCSGAAQDVPNNQGRIGTAGEREREREHDMSVETILPLDANGKIYALRDDKGNIVGTGTREVCEILLYIISKPATPSISARINTPVQHRPNVRSAIAI